MKDYYRPQTNNNGYDHGYDHTQVYVEQMREAIDKSGHIRFERIEDVEEGYNIALILEFEGKMPKLIAGRLTGFNKETISVEVSSTGLRRIISKTHVSNINRYSYKSCEIYGSSGDFRSWTTIQEFLDEP